MCNYRKPKFKYISECSRGMVERERYETLKGKDFIKALKHYGWFD